MINKDEIYEKKVSVIVPVYNGGKILEKSLLILSKQTLQDIEFICVNDASTDNSLNILKAFKEVFPDKFVVIDSPENRGPGGARNLGLQYAKGEYIGFVDHDDYVHEDMFKQMYKEAKYGDYDIVKCGFFDKGDGEISKLYNIKGKIDSYEKFYYFICDSFYVWNKIYKKTLISEMSMHFREKTNQEDTDFLLEAVMRAKSVSTLSQSYYYYNYDGESYSRGKNFLDFTRSITSVDKLLDAFGKRITSLKDHPFSDFTYFVLKTMQLKTIYYHMFFKEDLTASDFKGFYKLMTKYITCQELKNETIHTWSACPLAKIIFKTLDDEPEKMYENVSKLKNDIMNWKLGKNTRAEFLKLSESKKIIGNFCEIDI